jgi:hypothetical protein
MPESALIELLYGKARTRIRSPVLKTSPRSWQAGMRRIFHTRFGKLCGT